MAVNGSFHILPNAVLGSITAKKSQKPGITFLFDGM